MFKPKLFIIISLSTFLCFDAEAQLKKIDSSVNKPVAKNLFVNAGLQYLSALTYAGRRDPSSVPVILPSLTLISKKGLFISAIGYFDLNGSKSGTEGLSITPGYVFSFDKKKEYGGAVSATKYFITNSSPIILSSFNATLDGQLYFNPDDIVKLTVAASYRIGKQNENDVINDVELSKEIQITKSGKNNKDGLKITPDVTVYAGTQSFTLPADSSKSVVKSILSPSAPTSPQQVKKYSLLALSGSLQIAYVVKTWQFSFSPYIIKPYNSGQTGSYFLFTTGVNVTF
jgi:hypothetical protein